jgi:hypothetical protein
MKFQTYGFARSFILVSLDHRHRLDAALRGIARRYAFWSHRASALEQSK